MMKAVTVLVHVALISMIIKNTRGVAPPFDFFKLAIPWPHGYCNDRNCARTPEIFTIHDLWPTNTSGPPIEKCSTTSYTHLADLKDIESLDARWMDLSSSKSQVIEKQRFWSYEWEKHGTCSEKLYNQDQYFDLAVRLYEHFNITAILQNNKITRGNAHSLSSISAPIKAATGFQPDIRCIKSRKHQQQSILLEIGICWDFLGASPINSRQGYSCGNVRAGHDPRVLFP